MLNNGGNSSFLYWRINQYCTQCFKSTNFNDKYFKSHHVKEHPASFKEQRFINVWPLEQRLEEVYRVTKRFLSISGKDAYPHGWSDKDQVWWICTTNKEDTRRLWLFIVVVKQEKIMQRARWLQRSQKILGSLLSDTIM